MKRLALVLTLVVLGASGLASTRKPSRCHGLYGIAFVCNASAAATPAELFGRAWENGMNQYGAAAHKPLRIRGIRCVQDGEAVFICRMYVVDIVRKRIACMTATIGTSGQVLSSRLYRCPPAPNQA